MTREAALESVVEAMGMGRREHARGPQRNPVPHWRKVLGGRIRSLAERLFIWEMSVLRLEQRLARIEERLDAMERPKP